MWYTFSLLFITRPPFSSMTSYACIYLLEVILILSVYFGRVIMDYFMRLSM